MAAPDGPIRPSGIALGRLRFRFDLARSPFGFPECALPATKMLPPVCRAARRGELSATIAKEPEMVERVMEGM